MDRQTLRHGQLDRRAIDQTPGLGTEGVERAADDDRLDRARAVAEDRGADAVSAVGDVAAIDLVGLGQGLAALQTFDDEGIAALGQGARTEVSGDQKGVDVEPFEPVLALG